MKSIFECPVDFEKKCLLDNILFECVDDPCFFDSEMAAKLIDKFVAKLNKLNENLD